MKSKKAMAVLCALAVVFTSSGGLPFGGLRLFDTVVTASAETMSETIATNSGRNSTRLTFEGTNCSVDGFLEDIDGIAIGNFGGDSASIPITVSVGNGFKITKIEFKIGWKNTFLTIDELITSAGTLSSDSFAKSGVLTIDSIEDNVSKVELSNSVSKGIQFTSVKVYYEEPKSDPTYTITIPAEVDLKSTDPVNITATGVTLNEGQKIVVTLDGASNTDSGSEFSAKTENGKSEVKYKINDGAIGLDDSNKTVAEFTGNGERELNFAVTDESGIKYAGAHTETLTFGISVENAAPANPYAANNVGDVVTFGSYNWYIIGKSDNGVTLLMEKSFTNKVYNDSNTDVTWENCSLRTYLNGDFYNSFNESDRANIALTHNTNPNNGSTPGGNETDDYIYLLSIEEANALSDTIRAAEPSWWLRSPGYSSDTVAFVNENGKIDLNEGYRVSDGHRVRPALNLKF